MLLFPPLGMLLPYMSTCPILLKCNLLHGRKPFLIFPCYKSSLLNLSTPSIFICTSYLNNLYSHEFIGSLRGMIMSNSSLSLLPREWYQLIAKIC